MFATTGLNVATLIIMAERPYDDVGNPDPNSVEAAWALQCAVERPDQHKLRAGQAEEARNAIAETVRMLRQVGPVVCGPLEYSANDKGIIAPRFTERKA